MKKTFFSKALLLVAVALVGVAIATSCKKDKEERTDTQIPTDISQTDTTAVRVLDPYMDSIYRSIPDPDTSVRSSMNGFKIYGRWCWKSSIDTVCSLILDFCENGKAHLQCFQSDIHLDGHIGRFTNCYFGGWDSCTYTLRNDSLIIPLWYWTNNYGNVVIDTMVDPATLTIPDGWGVHKITLFNNQKVMRLNWTGYYGWCHDALNDFYLTKQERSNK